MQTKNVYCYSKIKLNLKMQTDSCFNTILLKKLKIAGNTTSALHQLCVFYVDSDNFADAGLAVK